MLSSIHAGSYLALIATMYFYSYMNRKINLLVPKPRMELRLATENDVEFSLTTGQLAETILTNISTPANQIIKIRVRQRKKIILLTL